VLPVATQIIIVVNNVGASAATNVVVTVALAPPLQPDQFKLVAPAAVWPTSGPAELTSAPVSIAAGQSQTLSFEITQIKGAPATILTSNVSVTSTSSGASATASPLQITIGG
jgi:hypothetical protein